MGIGVKEVDSLVAGMEMMEKKKKARNTYVH
jgi:hypothetical protein